MVFNLEKQCKYLDNRKGINICLREERVNETALNNEK
jgi:hypothetical protein